MSFQFWVETDSAELTEGQREGMDGYKAYLKGEFDWYRKWKEVSQQMNVFYVWMPSGGEGQGG